MTDLTQDLMIPGPAGRLSVRAKGLARPAATVILVPGASMSGRMGYDFSGSGGPGHSMMDAFVAAGVGAVTFSVRGDAESELNHGAFGVQTGQATEDLGAVVDWMAGEGHIRPLCSAGRGAAGSPGAVSRTELMDVAALNALGHLQNPRSRIFAASIDFLRAT